MDIDGKSLLFGQYWSALAQHSTAARRAASAGAGWLCSLHGLPGHNYLVDMWCMHNTQGTAAALAAIAWQARAITRYLPI